jgi:PadR family transcriptional regulator, regulatory protein PadR
MTSAAGRRLVPAGARRLSSQTIAVLTALAADPSAWRHGYELGQQIGLRAGSLYPILIRLCDRGLLEATWETDPPQGCPARHLYRLTGAGAVLAQQLVGSAPPPPLCRGGGDTVICGCVVSRRDAAGWLLAATARMLPPRRREWGMAIQAELGGIGPVLMATESWPPNVEIARRNLQHVGARVVEVDDHADLPFPAVHFDLVVSRHPTVTL